MSNDRTDARPYGKRWVALVDGKRLKGVRGQPRMYGSEEAALQAAELDLWLRKPK